MVCIGLALLAAAVFAVAVNLQHRVTRPSGSLPPLALAARILAHPVWLLGLVGNAVGFLLHALALLSRHDVVQAIGPGDGLAVGGLGVLAIAALVAASRLFRGVPPLRTALLGL